MQPQFLMFMAAATTFRLVTLAVSVRNERQLMDGGAQEYGAGNSLALAGCHVAFYLAAFGEAVARGEHEFGSTNYAGIFLYGLSAIALLMVMKSLDRLWTVKLILDPKHALVTSGIYRWIRHPNTFFNVLPEPIGLALALGAYCTLLIGLPLYLIPLTIRIRQEEALMRRRFPSYAVSSGNER